MASIVVGKPASSKPIVHPSSTTIKHLTPADEDAQDDETLNDNYADTERDSLIRTTDQSKGSGKNQHNHHYQINNNNMFKKLLPTFYDTHNSTTAKTATTTQQHQQSTYSNFDIFKPNSWINNNEMVNDSEDRQYYNSNQTTTQDHSASSSRISPRLQSRNSKRNQSTRTSNCTCSSLLLILLGLISFFLILFNEISIFNHYSSNDNKQLTVEQQQHQKSTSTSDHGDSSAAFYSNKTLQSVSSQWLISSSKCHIPIIEPWDKSIKGYVHLKPPLDCPAIQAAENKTKPALTYVQDNLLYFTKRALELNLHLGDNCCISEIIRNDENDTGLIFKNNCLIISGNPVLVDYEIIEINCDTTKSIMKSQGLNSNNFSPEQQQQQQQPPSNNHRMINYLNKSDVTYSNVHAFIIPKPEEANVLKRAIEKKLNVDEYYSIVMLGMDTISRLDAYRQLTKTLKILKETYKTIEFKGYNKVGENTFPNLIPLLTGLTPRQLVETKCWLSSNYTDENEVSDDYLDDCKYLWSFFQEFGYMTYFSEDWPQASTFDYLKAGFKSEPTAYYGRPITLARQKYITGSEHHMDCELCNLDKPIVELDLNHLKSFIKTYSSSPYFAFHWINCPQHQDLNDASTVDHLVEKFLTDIHKITQDKRTFVIFFSDHGWRWNNFISTRVGHYESSLPILTIAPPKQFIERHPDLYETLKSYEKTLLTPFDLFKTVIDIRNLGAKREEAEEAKRREQQAASFFKPPPIFQQTLNLQDQQQFFNQQQQAEHQSTKIKPHPAVEPYEESNPASNTTFTQIIPKNGITYKQNFTVLSLLEVNQLNETDRTCFEAGIPDNYCICHEFKEVSTTSNDVLGAAYYFVYVHLHKQIQFGKDICAPLELKRIDKAGRYDLPKKQQSANESRKRRASLGEQVSTELIAAAEAVAKQAEALATNNITSTTSNTTTAKPTIEKSETTKKSKRKYEHSLPKREYNIEVVTEPGEGIFQEVLRFYGANLKECESQVSKAKLILEDMTNSYETKISAVIKMNEECKFSIHSESISRLNLYKDQSKCVKSNNELKKVCYCKDLQISKQ